ncbi:MAG: DUF58 domain-containing protein, partial [Oscillospiraceae bacterium]|nr:DUF58 domain-containing protein [Oscillospiraceae bacterium]
MRRIIYACALAGSAFFFVLYPLWFSWYLFLLFLLLLPFDLLISLPGMLTRNITMYSPNILQSGDEGLVVITTHQKSHLPEFPARCVKLWIKVAGDDFTIWRRFVFGASGGSRQEVSIDTSRTGVTVFEVKRLWTVSLIGLVCLPANVNVSASVLVLPQPEKPPYTVALPRGVILRPKPGGGFSEDYDMRPYRLGDPIRSVHWKVSAKF